VSDALSQVHFKLIKLVFYFKTVKFARFLGSSALRELFSRRASCAHCYERSTK
jgi:hypothetical protein